MDSNGPALEAAVWRSLKDLEGHALFTKRLGEGEAGETSANNKHVSLGFCRHIASFNRSAVKGGDVWYVRSVICL